MKISWKIVLTLCLMLSGPAGKALAGQQVYLSTSPNDRYRIYVEQVIDRRVGDRVFFRYPVMLENTKRPDHHFWIIDVGSPLIQETETGTFKLHWDEGTSASSTPTPDTDPHQLGVETGDRPVEPNSIHFDWSKDSLKCFIRVEVLKGVWKTYFVNVNTGKTEDVTADLEQYLFKKTSDWACEEPEVTLIQWTKPHLAFFRLTSLCGKNKDKSNDERFFQKDSVLFDTELGKVVDDCMSCKDEKSVKAFDKYYINALPTPTPTPEETPVNQ